MFKEAYDAGCAQALIDFGLAEGQEKIAINWAGMGKSIKDWAGKPMSTFRDQRKLTQHLAGGAEAMQNMGHGDYLAGVGKDMWQAARANPWQAGALGGAAALGGAGLMGAGAAMGGQPEMSRMDHLKGLFTG